jgi:hypothetical protein
VSAGCVTAQLLEALEAHGCNPRKSGDGWLALCPCHDDRKPSLSIRQGVTDDGRERVIMHCFAGCEIEDVLRPLGWAQSDLYESRDAGGRNGWNGRPQATGRSHTSSSLAGQSGGFWLLPARRQRAPIEDRRAERELFFWTARETLKLVVLVAATVYMVVSLAHGRLPVEHELVELLGGYR